MGICLLFWKGSLCFLEAFRDPLFHNDSYRFPSEANSDYTSLCSWNFLATAGMGTEMVSPEHPSAANTWNSHSVNSGACAPAGGREPVYPILCVTTLTAGQVCSESHRPMSEPQKHLFTSLLATPLPCLLCLVCVCVSVCVGVHMEVRRQLTGVGSLCFPGCNLGS